MYAVLKWLDDRDRLLTPAPQYTSSCLTPELSLLPSMQELGSVVLAEFQVALEWAEFLVALELAEFLGVLVVLVASVA